MSEPPVLVRRTLEFPGRPESVRAARDAVAGLLGGDPGAGAVVLVVSELAANAVQHTGSPWFTVTVEQQRCGGWWVGVRDEGPRSGFPDFRDCAAHLLDVECESGRGLALVSLLCQGRCGITPSRDGRGLTVWGVAGG